MVRTPTITAGAYDWFIRMPDAEAQARMQIDEQLAAYGWVVQDYKHAAVAAAQGVAVREVPTGAGTADYALFVDRQAVGVIEAKKAGSTLTGVEPQTGKYRTAYPGELPAFTVDRALPSGYESTGAETRFTCGLDPIAASRRVFSLHRPEMLAHWVDEHVGLGGFATLRAGLQLLPQLGPDAPGLWPAQAETICNLEESLPLEVLDRGGNVDDLVAFMEDRNLPLDEIGRVALAERVLSDPPTQGYITISNALQWRLQYGHAITNAGGVDGVQDLVS